MGLTMSSLSSYWLGSYCVRCCRSSYSEAKGFSAGGAVMEACIIIMGEKGVTGRERRSEVSRLLSELWEWRYEVSEWRAEGL
jgi:hypothetical protein